MFSDDLQNARKYFHPFSVWLFSTFLSGAYGISRKLHHDACQHVVCCCAAIYAATCAATCAATSAELYIKLNLRISIQIGSVFFCVFHIALLGILADECNGIDPLPFQSLLGRV